MGRMDGKVVVISGAARGQGREHARLLAAEGADIVAFDICEPLAHPDYPGASWEDLVETQGIVVGLGRRCLISKTDARDLAGMRELADRAVQEMGRIDALVVNHGIWVVGENSWTTPEDSWQESIDVLLTGAWKTTAAFVPKIIEGGRGGAVVLTSSVLGKRGAPGGAAYSAAKHGVLGLTRTLAWELGDHLIRVNAVCPGAIGTTMTLGGPTVERMTEVWPRSMSLDRGLVNHDWMHPSEVSKSVLFLLSDDAANITGTEIMVDAGWNAF